MGGALGPYTLQAAIAACHARALVAEETDWTRITALYDALATLTPSPVIELNRAVAYAMAFGPAEGLAIVDAHRRRTGTAQLSPVAECPRRSASWAGSREARAEFERAASLTRNVRERDLLLDRASAVVDADDVEGVQP